MKNNNRKRSATLLALTTLGAWGLCGPAFAQDDEVVIESSPSTTIARQFVFGAAPLSTASITRRVSYADLDLRTQAGVQELGTRINSTAKSICDKLNELYGHSASERMSCIKSAVKDGMTQARSAIAVAEWKARAVKVSTR